MKRIVVLFAAVFIALVPPLAAVEVEVSWSPDSGKTLYPLPVYVSEGGKVLVRVTCGDPVLEPKDGYWYAQIKSRTDFASASTGKAPWAEGFHLQRTDPPWTSKSTRSVDFILDLGARGEGVMGKGNRWDNEQKKFVDAALPPCEALDGGAKLIVEIFYKDAQSGARNLGQKDLDLGFGPIPKSLKPLSGGVKELTIPTTPVRLLANRVLGPIPKGFTGLHMSAGSITPLDWELVVPRRFPSHGIGTGSKMRCFLPSKPPLVETKEGVRYERPNRTWWSHLQSPESDRGWGPECDYRYYTTDFRMLLGWAEEMGVELFMVAPGFPHQTKETAMAAVAYANGSVDDTTPIGVDRLGEDWKTVGFWARKRSEGDARHPPHPKPFAVAHWEIGNEEYYSHNSVPWSNWLFLTNYENTAEGRNSRTRAALYLDGRDFGGQRCEGFLEYAKGMKRVDGKIRIGAMLAPEHKAKWHWDWNDVLLARLKGVADFYTYHGYTHSSTLDEAGVALQAQKEGRTYITAIRAHMKAFGQEGVPLINSEWHPYEPIKAGSIRMSAALYDADMLGIMLEERLAFHCHYGPFDTKHGSNGGWMTLLRPINSAEYRKAPASEGLYDRPMAYRWPAYYAFWLWKDAGDALVAVENPWDATNQISVYAALGGKRTTLIAVNKTAQEQALRVAAFSSAGKARLDTVVPSKGRAGDEEVLLNGVDMASPEAQKIDDLDAVGPAALLSAEKGEFRVSMKPYSLARLRWDE